MPKTGTLAAKMAGWADGDWPSITEAGPPDRMMPLGSKALILTSSTDWKGWISQYNPASRRGRASSWGTWEPKSTISKRSVIGGYKQRRCGQQPWWCGYLLMTPSAPAG